jgi:hypothetical protein
MVVTRSSAYNSSLKKPAATSKSREIFTQSAKEAAIKRYKIYANASVIANPRSHLRVTNTVAAAASAAAATTTEVVQPKPTQCSSPPPSILRRSTRTRKVVNYSENQKAYSRNYHSDDHDDVYDDDEEEAANALLSLNDSPVSSVHSDNCYDQYQDQYQDQDDNDDELTEAVKHKQYCADNCINPMTPIVRYAYSFTVSDPSRQQHYASCYMIYNEKTRNYHLMNKNTTLVAHNPATSDEISPHALLTNYTSYSTTSVQAYILNILTPPQHHYCISAQFIGLILSDDKIRRLYDANACFYDIDLLMKTNSSNETLTGREIFILTPPTLFSNETFTASHIQCVFDILSRNN